MYFWLSLVKWSSLSFLSTLTSAVSLTITPEKTDKHRYECKAENGIGIPATRTFVVVVESEFPNWRYCFAHLTL